MTGGKERHMRGVHYAHMFIMEESIIYCIISHVNSLTWIYIYFSSSNESQSLHIITLQTAPNITKGITKSIHSYGCIATKNVSTMLCVYITAHTAGATTCEGK